MSALQTPRPGFSAAEASYVARILFEMDGTAIELGSERDQTFRVGTGQLSAILKISNSSQAQVELDFELELLRHIHRTDPDLPVPVQLPLATASTMRSGAPDDPSKSGAVGTSVGVISVGPAVGPTGAPVGYLGVARKGSTEHFVRMMRSLDGQHHATGTALSDHSVRHLGEILARLGRALRGFFHPAAGRRLLWDISRIPEVISLLDAVLDPQLRARASRAMDRFQQQALPQWTSLRAQVLHGDPNIDNVLFNEKGEVSAILDFGDSLHGPILGDVASALASAVMRGRDSAEETLRAARIFLDGYSIATPLEPLELSLLGVTLGARLASLLTVATWKAREQPANAPYFESLICDCRRTLELLDEVGEQGVDRALGVPAPHRPTAALQKTRARLFGSALADLFYESPVHVAAGRGPWLIDVDGRRLLDAYNNVVSVGHCHPRVTQAVVEQTRRINTHTRYLYEPLAELAERLTDGIASRYGLDTVMVLNSGSEANDLTWRLATSCTGAQGAIVTDHAYHGMTAAIADLSPQQWSDGYRPRHVETFTVTNADEGTSAAEGVEQAIARLAEREISPAAMYIEGAFTSEGVLTPSHEDIRDAVQAARAAGALIVADEVQAGHGRTGTHLWSFEKYGYSPDFVTMGKPMGNGYPVAAMVTRSEIVARFRTGKYYFSTFGGNPVAARAATTVFEVIEDEGLMDRVTRVSIMLSGMLVDMASKHAAIANIHNHGTLFGIQIAKLNGQASPGTANRIINALRHRGVLIGRTGRHDDVLKIRPPLVFGEREAAVLIDALDNALGELS